MAWLTYLAESRTHAYSSSCNVSHLLSFDEKSIVATEHICNINKLKNRLISPVHSYRITSNITLVWIPYVCANAKWHSSGNCHSHSIPQFHSHIHTHASVTHRHTPARTNNNNFPLVDERLFAIVPRMVLGCGSRFPVNIIHTIIAELT